MKYEETVINGVLNYRMAESEAWQPMSAERLTIMLLESRKGTMNVQFFHAPPAPTAVPFVQQPQMWPGWPTTFPVMCGTELNPIPTTSGMRSPPNLCSTASDPAIVPSNSHTQQQLTKYGPRNAR